MARQRRKKMFAGSHPMQKKYKTKRKTKDLDQVHEDMKPENAKELLGKREVDLDLPGEGQHYCLHCARHFIDLRAMKDHFRTKIHKRRLKKLSITPYTIEESERAGGVGTYIPPKKIVVKTQDVPEDTETSMEETGDDVKASNG